MFNKLLREERISPQPRARVRSSRAHLMTTQIQTQMPRKRPLLDKRDQEHHQLFHLPAPRMDKPRKEPRKTTNKRPSKRKLPQVMTHQTLKKMSSQLPKEFQPRKLSQPKKLLRTAVMKNHHLKKM